MADALRRPHERRSDQLNVLVRRPLTVASLVPRFLRTGTTATNQYRYDDFDSDADTDISGRLRRSSSASVLSLPSESRLTPPSTVPPSAPPPDGGRRPLAVIVDLPLGNFERSRAKSFYGKAQDVAGDSVGVDKAPERVGEGAAEVDESTLRAELGEDYALFAPRRRTADELSNQKAPNSDSATSRELSDDFSEDVQETDSQEADEFSSEEEDEDEGHVDVDKDTQEEEDDDDERELDTDEDEDSNPSRAWSESQSLAFKRSATAPQLRRCNTMGPLTAAAAQHGAHETQEDEAKESIVRRLVSATTPLGFGLKARKSTRRSKSCVNEVRFDPELTAKADELRYLIRDTRAESTLPSGTPLFVEEAGRPPRMAFVDGDIKRVRVRQAPAPKVPKHHGLRASMRFGMRRRRMSRSSQRLRKRRPAFGFGLGKLRRRKVRRRNIDDSDELTDDSNDATTVRSGRMSIFRFGKR